MEKLIKAWFIITLITFVLFKLGETMTVPYTEPAGNGNPYLLVLLVGWPFALLFIWITIRLARRTVASVSRWGRGGLLIGGVVMTGVAFYINAEQAKELREAIRLTDNASYALGWNQFTNIIYANQLTFLVLTVACMAVGVASTFLSSRHKTNEEQLK